MITFCIVLSIAFAAFYYFSRRAVIRYRKTVELYQTFMSQFKETPRSKIVKKYLVDDPIMEEVSDDCRSASATSNADMIVHTEMSDKMDSKGFRMGSVGTDSGLLRDNVHLSGQINNSKKILGPFRNSFNFKEKLLGRKKRESIN